MSELVDLFGRKVTYLRLSVTDRCDFRCKYCMSENMQFLPKKELLSLEELDHIATTFIKLGVKKLRVTGGEPLVRRDILSFFQRMTRHLESDFLKELTLTTNGSQLEKHASDLANAGVKRVNVSLDTLDEYKFNNITRWGQLSKVIKGIDAAQREGLRVKINCVALKGFNEDELFKITEWCANRDMDLTFIEVMPMGTLDDQERLLQFWSLKDLKTTLKENYTLSDIDETTGGPAKYSVIEETGQNIGFITPLTNNFCESCNRVRLTCTGELYQCLGNETSVSLRDACRNDRDLIQVIQKSILDKPEKHHFNYSHKQVIGKMSRHMSHTGG